ncbi:MAG: alpha/beta family hydrolase [Oligoflexales bacterium]
MNSILILGHSAGSSMHDPDFHILAQQLAPRGIAVLSIQFPYRIAGRRIAERVHKSTVSFKQAVDYAKQFQVPIFIGGRSYGGRVASHFLCEESSIHSFVSGCICLSFPLKTSKISDNSRGLHLKSLKVPLLVLQGDRDSMGHPSDITPLVNKEDKNTQVVTLEFADHGFKTLKKHTVSHHDILQQASIIIYDWIKSIVKI